MKNRLYITKETHIPPSDYESWPYYEYEFLLEDLKEYIDNENKRQEEENEKYNHNSDSSGMMRQMKSMMSSNSGFKSGSSMPKLPKF